MPRKPKELFTIEVPVSGRMMSYAIERSTDELDYFDDAVIKEAGINRKTLADTLMKDPAFRTQISKQMVDAALEGIDQALDYSEITHPRHPLIAAAVRAASKVAARFEKESEAREREARIKEALDILRNSGYNVTKQRRKTSA